MPFKIFAGLISARIHFDWWIDVAYWHEDFPSLPALYVTETACVGGDTCFDAADILFDAERLAIQLWCSGLWGDTFSLLLVESGQRVLGVIGGESSVESDGWETA